MIGYYVESTIRTQAVKIRFSLKALHTNTNTLHPCPNWMTCQNLYQKSTLSKFHILMKSSTLKISPRKFSTGLACLIWFPTSKISDTSAIILTMTMIFTSLPSVTSSILWMRRYRVGLELTDTRTQGLWEKLRSHLIRLGFDIHSKHNHEEVFDLGP